MSAFNPNNNKLSPAEWQNKASEAIEETGSQYLIIGGIVGGMIAASATAFPPTGFLVAAWAFYEAWKKTEATNRNEQAIIDYGCVAHVLRGDDFRAFKNQVGAEEVLLQVRWAQQNGYALSSDALDFLEEAKPVAQLPAAGTPLPEQETIAQLPVEQKPSKATSSPVLSAVAPKANTQSPNPWINNFVSQTALLWGNQGSGKSWMARYIAKLKKDKGYRVVVLDPDSNRAEWEGVESYHNFEEIAEFLRWYVDELMSRYKAFNSSNMTEDAWRASLWADGKAIALICEEVTTYVDLIEDKELLTQFFRLGLTKSRKQEMPLTFVSHNNNQTALGGIATARAVRTSGVRHTPSHREDNQTGRVACKYDF